MKKLTSLALLLVCCCLWPGSRTAADSGTIGTGLTEEVPAPPPVVRVRKVGAEMSAPLTYPSVHKASDGRLIMIGGGRMCVSTDGGKSWSKPQGLAAPVKFAIRLRCGKLGGPGADGHFYVSADEGQSWQKRGLMRAGNVPASPYEGGAVLIQTRTGRLVMPVRFTGGAGHMGQYDFAGCWGTLNGKLRHIEGHAHWPEPDNTYVLYSDDEGRSWQRSEGGIMIWHQEGYGGMWPVDEPTVVEATNGDILLFVRNTLGRLYIVRSRPVSYINRQGKRVAFPAGHQFDHPQPTGLAMSYSPCVVRRIAKTGHLLLVWNQVSGAEIRAGYRRGRLSAAISKDDGATWQHFRTVDRLVVPPRGRVAPDPEPRMARGLDYVGILPADFGHVSYPTVEVVDETVFLFWSRTVVQPRSGDVTGRRLWVLPLSWFYTEEPPLPPGPKLILRVPAGDGKSWNSFEIPADWYEGRHYCNSRDLETYLKSPVGRLGFDMYAPLHQIITCLGWTPHYDRTHLKDKESPRLVVYCTHPHATPPPVPVLPAPTR